MINSRFSVQDHYRKKARSNHFDLRVVNPRGTSLWSWAIPKAKFPDYSEKLLAIRTPDHAISYFQFEGVLENGDVVKVYDTGTCQIAVDTQKQKVIMFYGSKVKGLYVFIKVYGSKEDSWILLKSRKK